MGQSFCQSCAMPLGDQADVYGTNADESKNEDYCIHCYQDGQFTSDVSMEQMIDVCVPHMVKANKEMSELVARDLMKTFFPTLKRWQEN